LDTRYNISTLVQSYGLKWVGLLGPNHAGGRDDPYLSDKSRDRGHLALSTDTYFAGRGTIINTSAHEWYASVCDTRLTGGTGTHGAGKGFLAMAIFTVAVRSTISITDTFG